MSRIRSAATLLVILVLLTAASQASAAVAALTPNPPVALPRAQRRVPAPRRELVRRSADATVAPAAGAIPRTGIDAGLEALVGAVLIATGGALRARHPVARRVRSVYVEPVRVGQRR